MSFDNDQWLREVAAGAYGLPAEELLRALHVSCDDPTEAYEALLIRVREVLATRYTPERVTQLLGHLSRPNRDTIVRNTGNLPNG